MIEVGEYVKTTDAEIHKIIEIIDSDDELERYYKFENDMGTFEEYILKHSKKIIDLIEVGDYVNGYCCRYITDIDTGEEHLCNYDLNEMRWIPLEDIDVIEEILTKEQYNANCSRLEE